MQKDNRQAPFVNIGSSLLLVIFLVLCLVTFATLSLSSARSDYSFSSRGASRRTEYYQASNIAEDVLAQVDAILYKAEERAVSAADSSRDWQKELDFTQIEGTEFTEIGLEILFDAEDSSLSFQVPVNERQALEVRLALTWESTDGYYQIEQWQLVNTAARETGQTLQLLPMPEAE